MHGMSLILPAIYDPADMYLARLDGALLQQVHHLRQTRRERPGVNRPRYVLTTY